MSARWPGWPAIAVLLSGLLLWGPALAQTGGISGFGGALDDTDDAGPAPAEPGDPVHVEADGASADYQAAADGPSGGNLTVAIAPTLPWMVAGEPMGVSITVGWNGRGTSPPLRLRLAADQEDGAPEIVALDSTLPPADGVGPGDCAQVSGAELDCRLGRLLPGRSVVLEITLSAPDGDGRGPPLVLRAEGASASGDRASDEDSFTVYRVAPADPDTLIDLEVGYEGLDQLAVEGWLSSPQFTVTNTDAASPASNIEVQIRYRLLVRDRSGGIGPAETGLSVELTSSGGAATDCEVVEGGYDCRIDRLGPGESTTYMLEMQADGFAGEFARAELRARARAIEPDPTPLNRAGGSITYVTARPNAAIVTPARVPATGETTVRTVRRLTPGRLYQVRLRWLDPAATPRGALEIHLRCGEEDLVLPLRWDPRSPQSVATRFRTDAWAVEAARTGGDAAADDDATPTLSLPAAGDGPVQVILMAEGEELTLLEIPAVSSE
ncbi:MAG: hypothetical protein KDA49_12570 [Rhodospirillaceae bacterium]|nr:hypothetical protein [Rhodospirillaceae bacterium]